MALPVLFALGRIRPGGLVIGSSTNANFCRVHQIVNDIGNVLVLKLVRGGSWGLAIYLWPVGVDILRVGIDLDRLRAARGVASCG